jgi:ketosteroid isomerase-like protein
MSKIELYEFANEAFYLAFEAKDFEAMAHIWCEQGDPVCSHPGWPALIGRQAILESWKNILGNSAQGRVSFYSAHVSIISENSAAVVCYEQAGDQTMIATNVFKVEDGRPKLFIHQGGFCQHPPPAPR